MVVQETKETAEKTIMETIILLAPCGLWHKPVSYALVLGTLPQAFTWS